MKPLIKLFLSNNFYKWMFKWLSRDEHTDTEFLYSLLDYAIKALHNNMFVFK